MSKIIEDAAPIILDRIKLSHQVLLHCHPGPDPDSVGSALAFREALIGLGKQATIIRGDSEVPPAFSCFPGYDQIVASKYSEIDASGYDLFLILDSGGINQIAKREQVVFPATMRTVLIDHHASNPGFAEINCIDPSYPATAQILFDLFKLWGIKITPTMAINLMLGIYADTGGFKFTGTSAETFGAAAALAVMAPDFPNYIFAMENNATPESLEFEALALGSVELFGSDHLAIATVPYVVLEEKRISRQDAQGSEIATKLRTVAGWNITVCMVEKEPQVWSVSFRSRDPEKYDVSKLAAALGGGGHRAAAGALLEGPRDAVRDNIIKMCYTLKYV